jgi:nucleotide-binding universal stress UspA family protein
MFKNILVAIDGSDHARKALDIAADLAEKYDAQIILMHVIPKIRVPIEHSELTWEPWTVSLGGSKPGHYQTNSPELAHYQRFTEELLQDAEEQLKEHKIRPFRPLIGSGAPSQAILQAAKTEGVDLIVLGTRGLSDTQGLLMGSVAHKVSHLAECTVVTVK